MNEDKFNVYAKAQEEAQELSTKETKVTIAKKRRRRETKEQMSIMLTPTNKAKIRSMADELGISASELIAEWIEEKSH